MSTIYGFVLRDDSAANVQSQSAEGAGEISGPTEGGDAPIVKGDSTPAASGTPLQPMPYAEVAVISENLNTVVTADADGWFSITVPETDNVTIKSAAKALKFLDINGQVVEEVTGVASTLTTQNPYYIKSRSQIVQGPMCQFTKGGEAYIRFPYTQRTAETLTVLSGSRNYLIAGSGIPLPAEEFETTAPGNNDDTTSFSRPLRDFVGDNGALEVEWYLYGGLAPRQDPLPVCADSGNLSQCTAVSLSGLDRVFNEVSSTAVQISKRIVSKKGNIKFTGKTRIAFLKRRAAPNLARLRLLLRLLPTTAYSCPATPTTCQTRTLPKTEMLNYLETLFKTKWPSEIKPAIKGINKLAPPARKRIKAILSEYPDTFVTCDGQ
jgi:hypothetical protein